MPDIAMCEGGSCKLKETCYRHTAKPDYYQSYFSEPPVDGDKCDYYLPDRRKERSRTDTKSHKKD